MNSIIRFTLCSRHHSCIRRLFILLTPKPSQHCRLIYKPPVKISPTIVCYASASNVTNSSFVSTKMTHQNWADIDLARETGTLPSEPNASFTTKVIQYLANRSKQTLQASIIEQILNKFKFWTPHELYDVIWLLGSYGFQPEDALRLIITVPNGDKSILNKVTIQGCIESLIRLKFDATARSILISHDPNVLQCDLDYLSERIGVLSCYFTSREINKLIRTHSRLLTEQWTKLDYKINYLRIMLFASTRDIVECGALSYPIEHIRSRYLFVYRCGLWTRVRREEQYFRQRKLNISLHDIFDTSIQTFLKRVTSNLLRHDDYQAFVDSLKYEKFQNEMDKYLTLKGDKKHWTKGQILREKTERNHFMYEFDLYDMTKQKIEEEENDNEYLDDGIMTLETQLTTYDQDKQQQLQKIDLSRQTFDHIMKDAHVNEAKTSDEHPLLDLGRESGRSKRIAQKADPDLR